MADQEQLDLLKQGVGVWNKWRENNITADINLRDANIGRIDLTGAELLGADLSGADFQLANLNKANLRGANLYRAYLTGANLRGTDLRETDLVRAYLNGTDLNGADLSGAYLSTADLNLANLSGANLTGADLEGADLSGAYLMEANLREADLSLAYFNGADLSEADLSGAKSGGTVFTSVDLSNVKGLKLIMHIGASSVGTNTLFLSEGKIPEIFLRGCGLSNWEIEAAKLYNPDLADKERNDILYRIHDLQAGQPIQVSPLFISYSHSDTEFVDRMEKSLNQKGIRFWRDKHNMKAGRIERQIDRAIRQNPTVLLILSENSTKSDWVQHEVRLARKLEKDTDRDVLCPVALDDAWKSSPWPERIMEQVMEYNILDFSEWEDDKKFEKMFVRLIDGLNLFYKKEEE